MAVGPIAALSYLRQAHLQHRFQPCVVNGSQAGSPWTYCMVIHAQSFLFGKLTCSKAVYSYSVQAVLLDNLHVVTTRTARLTTDVWHQAARIALLLSCACKY